MAGAVLFRAGPGAPDRTEGGPAWPPRQGWNRALLGFFRPTGFVLSPLLPLYLLCQLAGRLGLPAILGADRQGRLALWQVLARLRDQGSRLSAVRLARSEAVAELLGLGEFSEDDLYANLDWLSGQQALIIVAEGRSPTDGTG